MIHDSAHDDEIEIEEGHPDAGLPDVRRIRAAARDVFGWSPLRAGLARAVQEVLSGNDVLGVMPTGYGKSAVYRLAGQLLPGTTVVVSPLIALQVDQLRALDEQEGTRPAAIVNSGQSDGANEAAWSALADGSLGYLFLAPEQLAREEVVQRLAEAHVSVFAVDEAHCVSSWGHDFRPDYLRLGEVAEHLTGEDGRERPPILALTATGSGPVRDEIVERLRMRDAVVLTHGFDRPNIHLRVRRHPEEDRKVDAVLADVRGFEQPGLLYVATRKATEVFADALATGGLRAVAYHAGLGARRRRELSAGFSAGDYDVVVATSAFGMGIDKSDIRYVVHAAVTESVDEYYQELGRAGRDGEPSAAVLHYRPEDLGLKKFFSGGAPKRGDLRRVHGALGDGPSLEVLAERTGLTARRATSLANLFEEAGAVRFADDAVQLLEPDEQRAVDAALEVAAARKRIEESRLTMMRSYAETTGCRRQYLLAYFGDEAAETCGNCDTCESGSAERFALTRAADGDEPFAVDASVKHAIWGDGTVMSVEEDRVTVFFASEGYRVLSLAAIEEHDLLVPA